MIREFEPDLAFLDVRMPGGGAFEILDLLDPAEPPVIVLVTAYREYAPAAYDRQVLDYLVKPFDDARFEDTMRRVLQRLTEQEAFHTVQAVRAALLDSPGDATTATSNHLAAPSRLAVREGEHTHLIDPADISWIEADGPHIRVHTAARVYRARGRLRALQDRLDPTQFVRIHRSAIVQVDQVRELQPYFHGDYVVILRSGEKLRLSRRRGAALRQLIGD
jgi:two-component system LytT family response regulator